MIQVHDDPPLTEGENSKMSEESAPAIDEAEMAENAKACVAGFVERYNARDLVGYDDFLHFPHLVFPGQRWISWDKPGVNLPESYYKDSEATGWDRTLIKDQRVVLITPGKVHLVVDLSRVRKDGSVISDSSNLWIVAYIDGRWGISVRSS